MKAKYTPGQWKSVLDVSYDHHYSFHVEDCNGKTICKFKDDSAACKEDSDLISAAPDMLEALDELVKEMDKFIMDYYPLWGGFVNAKAAIAKAKGGQGA